MIDLVANHHYAQAFLDPPHLILLMAAALIIFGPKKLPEIGRGLGSALREFNKAKQDFMESLNSEMHKVESTVNDSVAPALAPEGTASHYDAGHYDPSHYDSSAPVHKTLEYPQPLEAAHSEALPYGGDFHAVEGDSQPSFRTTQPETATLSAAAPGNAHSGEGKA